MFKRKFNKKGLTLVEVIVASAVSSILLAGILSIILPTVETVRFNENLAHAKNMSSQLIQQVSNAVQYAKSISIESGTYTPSGGSAAAKSAIYQEYDTVDTNLLKTMYIKKGQITANDLLGEGFYDNLKFTITYEKAATKADILQMNISVTKKNRSTVVFKTSASIKLYNANVVDHSGATDGTYILFE